MSQFQHPNCTATSVFLSINQDTDFETWHEIGEQLVHYGTLDGSVGFWIGDWMIFGHDKQWGSLYDGVIRNFGFSRASLRALYNVCANVRWNIRRPELKFAHHREVADLQYDDEKLAWLQKAIEQKLTPVKLKAAIREDRRRKKDEELGKRYIASDSCKLFVSPVGKLDEHIADNSIDAIITDPPYPQEFLYTYRDLAEQAARILKPGGSLLAMCGESYLPQIYSYLNEFLQYHWTIGWFMDGPTVQIFPRKVFTAWKPILWFVKGKYNGEWVRDTVLPDAPDKEFHEWGQDVAGFQALVKAFTKPGDLVCDPFLGGGATALACIREKRMFIGSDIDSKWIDVTKGRIVEGK